MVRQAKRAVLWNRPEVINKTHNNSASSEQELTQMSGESTDNSECR